MRKGKSQPYPAADSWVEAEGVLKSYEEGRIFYHEPTQTTRTFTLLSREYPYNPVL